MTPPAYTHNPIPPMDTPLIEAAFRDWWIDSYNRPPNPQALMTHVAFAEHVLERLERLKAAQSLTQ